MRVSAVICMLLLYLLVLPSSGVAVDISNPEIIEDKASSTEQSGTQGAEAANENDTVVSERIVGLPGLPNFGRVSPGIYRGAQPGPEGYSELKKMGIRTVINLRSRHSEKEDVEATGMQTVEIPMSVLRVSDEAVKEVLSIMSSPERQPVFIHCRQGKDRTGLVVAVYRMEVDGWSPEEAVEEMQVYGFHDIWHRLKEYILNYPLSGTNAKQQGLPE